MRAFGLLGLVFSVAIGWYIYSKQVQPAPGAPAATRATVDVAGVKNDLLNIARAERGEFALEGKYLSIDDLRSKGAISLPQSGRGPYSYSADIGSSTFRIVATYSGPPDTGSPQTISVDDSMQVSVQ